MDRTAALERIAEVVRNPAIPAREWKERTGGKVVGCLSCMPPFTPEEIVHAAGMLPVGIWGAEIAVSEADARIQSFACSVARTALEMGLKGMVDVCDGFAFPSTCDAYQNLSEIWRTATDKPCFQVTFPKKVDRRAAVTYLGRELDLFRGELARFAGAPVDEEALQRSLAVYGENRRCLREMDRLRAREPSFLSSRRMLEVVLAASFLPREEHTELLRALLDGGGGAAAAQDGSEGGAAGPVRVFLTGVMPRPAEMLTVIEDAGGWVVGDDLGLGSLYYGIEIPDGGTPSERLVRGYLGYPPCSTLHDASVSRSATLIDRVRGTQAEGVLILATKFCEPEFFDYPQLKEDLEQSGVPVLLLESELGSAAPGGLQTRVQAFLETLEGSKTA